MKAAFARIQGAILIAAATVAFSFVLQVRAEGAPTIDAHADIIAEATSASGALVNFDVLAHDEVDGDVPADCLPASGSTFSFGATDVACNYTNSLLVPAVTVHFSVTVQDTKPPLINPHSNVEKVATGALTEVNYGTPNIFDPVGFRIDSTRPADCEPPSGSLFPIGTTHIVCTGSDSQGNAAASVEFDVIVTLPPGPDCPSGFHLEGESCALDEPLPPPPPPVTDVCANIEGVQETPPEGTVFVEPDQCVTPESSDTVEPPADPAPTGGGGGGGDGSSRRNGSGTTPSIGEVLGASTCSPLLSSYLKFGNENDTSEVAKLQEFLNKQLGLTLPITGIFDSATLEAVKTFQKTYWMAILQPWFGIPGSGITTADAATGYVYLTTRWMINTLWCPGSELFPAKLF